MNEALRLSRSRAIEKLAQLTVDCVVGNKIPIDVLKIAEREGIAVGAGNFGPDFKGRIEFHPSVRRFLLFYPNSKSDTDWKQTRFSIAHELGHFYLPDHRKLLMSGRTHNSRSGFICDNVLEREADEFAAALLIPDRLLASTPIAKQISLDSIVNVSMKADASVTASAIRGTRYTEEASILIASQNGRVRFIVPSEEAQALGYRWIAQTHFPMDSVTGRYVKSDGKSASSGRATSATWFPDARETRDGWEEVMTLGKTGIVLTLLILED